MSHLVPRSILTLTQAKSLELPKSKVSKIKNGMTPLLYK